MITRLVLTSVLLNVSIGLQMYWNAPNDQCKKKFNITFHLDEFDIIHNANGKFMGEQIAVFYEHDYQGNGAWPYYEGYNVNKSIAGGLPQLGNLTEHLRIFKKRIENVFPQDFEGLAIIDLEEWRPMFKLNWGVKNVYRDQSVALARKNHPSLSTKALKLIGATEFDESAKKWVLETLRLAKSLRPKAKWGYYGFPYCNYDAGKQGTNQCGENFKKYNNELRWLYDEVTAFYADIYFYTGSIPSINSIYAQAVLNETKRIRDKVNPKTPIYAYTKFEYDSDKPGEHYYQQEDLCNSLRRISDFGLDGGLVWSTTSKLTKLRCEKMDEEIKNTFGPYLNLIRKREEKCRRKRCSGHGKCLRFEPIVNCDLSLDTEDYSCRCDDGWTGDYCEYNRFMDFPQPTLLIPFLIPPTSLPSPIEDYEDDEDNSEEAEDSQETSLRVSVIQL